MRRAPSTSLALGFLSAVAPLLCGGAPRAQAAASPLTLRAQTWKPSVVVHEPILVRLSLRNDTRAPLAVVPPYLNVGLAEPSAWPLTFAVTDDQGQRARNGWQEAGTGYELMAYGVPWWRRLAARSGLPGRRSPGAWRLLGHETGLMWIDLLQFYPLDKPGRYHVVLRYAAREGMLSPSISASGLPAATWTGELEADAGWVTVREPDADDPDRQAAAWLLAARTRTGTVMSAAQGAHVRQTVLERYPATVYTPYAEFFSLYESLWSGRAGAARHVAAAREFAETHSDFPLNYRLLLASQFGRWAQWARHTGPEDLAQPRFGGELRRRLEETESDLRRALARTSDFEFRQWAELKLLQWHRGMGPRDGEGGSIGTP